MGYVINEFFFYNRFLEILYFYGNKSSSFSYNYFINYYFFNLINYFFYLKDGVISFFINSNHTDSSLFKINFNKSIIENNLNSDSSANFKTVNFMFKNNFYSNLNYDSFFVYFFIFFYLIYSLPFFLISIIKNIFDLSKILELMYDYYLLITS
jgi:hypothetical protein